MADVRWRGSTSTRHPGRVGALVHQCLRGDGDVRAEDHSRLLRLSRRVVSVQYPAPGDPQPAEEIADLAAPTLVGLDADSWGIDHGTWSVLVHAFPAADIPVVQLSINATKLFEYHLELGAKLV